MTKRTRTILFISLAVLFCSIAPLVVFYSLGWRIDWETKKITQPGILYIKAYPKSTHIYINGKLKKKSDFFFNTALVNNLPPQKYNVEVKKQEFYTWQKTLEIKARQVTEAKNIILIPKNPVIKSLSKEIEDIFFSPNGKKAILKEMSGQNWSLKILDLNRNVKSRLIEEENFLTTLDISKGKKAVLINLSFSHDSKRVLLELEIGRKLERYILEIDESIPIFLNFSGKIEFNPRDNNKLLLYEKEELIEINLNNKATSSILKGIVSYSILKSNIYYLDKTGFLFKSDFSFNQRERLNIYPFLLKQKADYKIYASPNDIFIKENKTLYIFNREKRTFEKVSELVKDLKFSLDYKKIAYFNNNEIWILSLEKQYNQPQKEKGDKLFLTRFSEEISRISWYTDYYLIFSIKDKIKVAEIDDRDKINIVDLAEFKDPEIFWNQINKKLYILSDKTLYASDKLVP